MDSLNYKKMHYIYTLAFERNVFYIGMTYTPKERFSQHISDGLKNSMFIKLLMEFTNGFPRMDIIDCHEDRAIARLLEEEYVAYCSAAPNHLFPMGLTNQLVVADFIYRFFPRRSAFGAIKIPSTKRYKHIDLQILKALKNYETNKFEYMGDAESLRRRVIETNRKRHFYSKGKQLGEAWENSIQEIRRLRNDAGKQKLSKNKVA